jgi:hypothetical protein
MTRILCLGVCLLGLMSIPAFAVTCTQGKAGCMKTGGDAQSCEQRRQACMASGCWNGALVQKCGYVKKSEKR